MRDVAPDRGEAPAWGWPEGDPGDDTSGPHRRWLLLAAAAVPWAVVAVVVFRPTEVSTPAEPAPEPVTAPSDDAGDHPPAHPPAAAGGLEAPVATSDVEATLVSSAARHTPDVGDAVTVAVLVARAWFVGPGPQAAPVDPALAGDQPGYVEHLWVEAVDAPWRGQVVVVLGALVLEETDDAFTPRPRRLAVPVQLDAAGARAAGAPYLLPDPDLRFEPLTFEPVDDTETAVAAGQALVEAGYRVDEVLGLGRAVDSWPWSVTFRSAETQGAPTTRTVWLRAHLDGFVVAGWLPPRVSAPGPAPDRSPEPAPDTEEVAP